MAAKNPCEVSSDNEASQSVDGRGGVNLPENESGINFVKEVPNELKCLLCLDVLNVPTLTSCGHHFCNGCIQSVFSIAGTAVECPVCRQNNPTTMIDRATERRINGLKVHCSNKLEGCTWIGEKVEVEKHTHNSCEFELVHCEYKGVGCVEKVMRKDLSEHLVRSISRHLYLTMKATEKQCVQLQEKDKEIEALKTHVQELENSRRMRWTPTDKHFGPIDLSKGPYTHRFEITPAMVPDGAHEILLFLALNSGNAGPHSVSHQLSIYTESEQGERYTKYVVVVTYNQNAWNNNTENMWLPLTLNRAVFVTVPQQLTNNISLTVKLIGYR